MVRKRERREIILDMLISIQNKQGKIKPTHLMYKANLAYPQMQSYLEDLINKELVKKVKEKNYEYIIITDVGSRFVEKIKLMKEFEKTFGL